MEGRRKVQLEIIMLLMYEHSRQGRLAYVPLETIYQHLCEEGDENCKAIVRKSLSLLVKQGLVQKHSRGRNRKEYRLAGVLREWWKRLDELYRYS